MPSLVDPKNLWRIRSLEPTVLTQIYWEKNPLQTHLIALLAIERSLVGD